VATVSPGLASKPVVGFLVEPRNQGGGGFPGLGLKTGSYGLVIWVSKSPRRFLDLSLKIKQTTVCQLSHKTDGRATVWDMRRDLVACFTWKQVRLGFLSLVSRLTEAPSQKLCQVQVEDGRVDTTGCVGPCYSCFIIFFILGHRGSLVF
jgi:hypothetical protein